MGVCKVIVDKINQYLTEQGNKSVNEYILKEFGELAKFSFQRQFCTNQEEAVSTGKLRLSAAGKCPRALAYAYHGFEKKGKELDSRSAIVFAQGDYVEAMVTQLAKLSGVVLLGIGLNQVNVEMLVKGTKVVGHPDGFMIHNTEMGLFECKSMSSFSFARFEKGEIDEGYIAQIQSYMFGSGMNWCCIVAVNKDSGVMAEQIVRFDKEIVQKVHDNLAKVLQSTPETLPDAPQTLDCNEKGLYPWNCLYCSWWGLCRTNAVKTLVGKSYKLKEQPKKEKTDDQ
jgi:hypothetical protein